MAFSRVACCITTGTPTIVRGGAITVSTGPVTSGCSKPQSSAYYSETEGTANAMRDKARRARGAGLLHAARHGDTPTTPEMASRDSPVPAESPKRLGPAPGTLEPASRILCLPTPIRRYVRDLAEPVPDDTALNSSTGMRTNATPPRRWSAGRRLTAEYRPVAVPDAHFPMPGSVRLTMPRGTHERACTGHSGPVRPVEGR